VGNDWVDDWVDDESFKGLKDILERMKRYSWKNEMAGPVSHLLNQ